MKTTLLATIALTSATYVQSAALPLLSFHGIGDACSNEGMGDLTTEYAKAAGAPFGLCVEYGAGSDSWFTTLAAQVDKACKVLQADKRFAGGQVPVNVIGLSQGNLVARGIIQTCDAVTVKAYVSVGGPQAGTDSMPQCETGFICNTINSIIKWGVYSSLAQDMIAPANYFKAPTEYQEYLADSKYLPFINNEGATKNPDFKARFSALEKLVLIKYDQDTVLSPPDTEWFQYYVIGQEKIITTLEETPLYKEDWIGLKALNEAGKVSFVAVPEGNHLSHLALTDPLVVNTIIPALKTADDSADDVVAVKMLR